jgi:peroxiredoxin
MNGRIRAFCWALGLMVWLAVSFSCTLEAGDRAPEFSVTDLEGRTLTSGDLRTAHDALLVNFWGLRCEACLEEIPHLNELKSRLGNSLAILGVNVDGVEATFLKEQMVRMGLQIRYIVVPDPEMKMIDLFQMNGAPLSILIAKDGSVRMRHENYKKGDEKKIEQAVRDLLQSAK